jgi:hypothetical protein
MQEDDFWERAGRLWAAKIDLGTAGLLDFNSAPQYGLQAGDLVADDYGACQAFASQVRANNALPRTWIVPSAALAGFSNVVIFGPRVHAPYIAPPIDPAVDVPATLASERAHPPIFLLPHVRFHGQRHVALDAWNRREDYVAPEAFDLTLPD